MHWLEARLPGKVRNEHMSVTDKNAATTRTAPAKTQPLNHVALDRLETLLAEEMEQQTLFDCTINWYCNINT
jgi:hypothetical protein